jgi:YD repeat-containing protein
MRHLAAALAVLLSGPALAQNVITGMTPNEEPTAVRDSLRGPVRSVRSTATGVLSSDIAIVTTYDRTGRRAELLTYRADDLVSRLVYTYDQRGRNNGWEHYQVPRVGGLHISTPSPPGTPLSTVPERRVYVLDEAGRRIEEREFLPNGTLLRRTEFAHDSAGRTRLMTMFDHRGEVSSRTVQEYDAAGRVRAQRFFHGVGMESRTIYDYDERGNLKLSESYGFDGRLEARQVTRYDSTGRKREEEIYHDAQPRWRVEYRYDAEGRLREKETFDANPRLSAPPPGPERGKVVYTYHPEGGHTTEMLRYDAGGALSGRRVERFDASGKRVEWEEFHADGRRVEKFVSDPATRGAQTLAGRMRWIEERDAHGNWTRRGYMVVPDDGGTPRPLWEQVREITYW